MPSPHILVVAAARRSLRTLVLPFFNVQDLATAEWCSLVANTLPGTFGKFSSLLTRKHTGERPFQCHCQKSFSRLDNLRQHCQTVHADTPALNEDMLRRLTTLHSSLAATAARNQQAYARVVRKPSVVHTTDEPESLPDSSLDCVDFGAMDRAATDPYPQHRRESIPKTIRSRTSEIASTPFLGTDPLQMRSSSPSPMSTSPVLQGIPRTGLWHMNNFRINVPNNQLRPSDAMGVYPESTEVSPLDERDDRRTLPLPPGAQTPMLAYPSSPYSRAPPTRAMSSDQRSSWSFRGEPLMRPGIYDARRSSTIAVPNEKTNNTESLRSVRVPLYPPSGVPARPLPPLVALDRLRNDSDTGELGSRSGTGFRSSSGSTSGSISPSPLRADPEVQVPITHRWSLAGTEALPAFRAETFPRVPAGRTGSGWPIMAPFGHSTDVVPRMVEVSRKRKADEY